MSLTASVERQKQLAARVLIELYKAYLNMVPYRIGCETLWKHFVETRLWWRRYDFTTRTGFGAKIIGSTDEEIQKCILFFGQWEPNLTRFVKERLRPGDVFVDIGAYFGYYSLLASKLVGKSGRVVAVEASPRNFSLLMRNLECNAVQNVRTLNAAASSVEGTVQLYLAKDRDTGCTTANKEWADRYGLTSICQVPALPLASMLRPDEIQGARLIKIDVEGGEWDVVLGMVDMLPLCRHDLEITVEVSPLCLKSRGKSSEDLLEIFARRKFWPYRLEEDVSIPGFVRRCNFARPVRIRGPVLDQTEVVFSRTDADHI